MFKPLTKDNISVSHSRLRKQSLSLLFHQFSAGIQASINRGATGIRKILCTLCTILIYSVQFYFGKYNAIVKCYT